MKACPTWEALANYIDGADAADGIECHIAECATCRAVIERLREDQQLLQTEPEIADSAFTDVRLRVMSQVSRRRSSHSYWMAGLIAASLLIAMFWPRTEPQLPAPAPLPLVVQAPTQPAIAPAVQKNVRKRQAHARPGESQSSPAELIAALDNLYNDPPSSGAGLPGQVVITMETEDPNVTIILLGENKGDEE